MKVLITDICGFVGSQFATHLKTFLSGVEIVRLDNLIRFRDEPG
jgi:nucleoside-diphosphate-sugar epimerase